MYSKEEIERLRKRILKEIACKRCGQLFLQTSARQIFCGSKDQELGCSYIAHLERNRTNKQRKREEFRLKNHFYKTERSIGSNRLKLRFELLKEANSTCLYCGRQAPDVHLQIDHKYPKSKGGMDKKENFVVACKECNLGKGDVILDEFK